MGPLITGDEIKAEIRRRKSKDQLKTISAANKKLIDEKVEIEKKDGWRPIKKNAKSTRMAKPKPADEQLEDEVWVMLAQMGFKEMSAGRDFRINVGPDVQPRQIDAFAKDDEAIVLVECTQSPTPGKSTRRINSLIEKLKAHKEAMLKSIKSHYGRGSNLKIRMIIATRNIRWGEADKSKCDEENITRLEDVELDYYAKLVMLYKTAARYQLLAHIFGGSKVDGLKQVVHATKGTMGKIPYYTFHIKPDELLKISYIGHKASRSADDLDTYQRLVVPKRLKEIAKYIDGGGKFPTNIVVNIRTNKGTPLLFERQVRVGDDLHGDLTLPSIYGCAWVIDGQHRLYGYSYARELENKAFKDDRSTLPVLAFENLDPKEEMKLFADINSKQVNVKRDLLEEIHADLFWGSEDAERGHNALLSRIPAALNSKSGSPLYERMKLSVPGKSKKTRQRCLTLTSLRDGLDEARLAGTFYKGEIHPGPFVTGVGSNYKANLSKCVAILDGCFDALRSNAPDHWALGDDPGGYLCTNNGIRATFLLLKAVCEHIEASTGDRLFALNSEEVVERIEPFVRPVAHFFQGASPSKVARIRTGESSKSAVARQSLDLAEIVAGSIPDFSPPGLKEHVESRDMEGTERAELTIGKISVTLNNFVVRVLKEKYGDDYKEWWAARIPSGVMTKASKRRDEDKWEKPVETYVDLGDYQSIALINWELMGSALSLGDKDADNKKKVTSWIDKLVRIRRTTHHREKGPATKEEVLFVDEIWKKVRAHLPEQDIDGG